MNKKSSLEWRIGCSGFHYPDWTEVFYPRSLPRSKWFEYYCRHFNTLELNVTFYRFPQLKFLQTWYNQSPEGFDFSLKVPRLITHYKQFNDVKRMLGDFYGTCRDGLLEKLGCILYQLPSRMKYTKELLEKIISVTDPAFQNVIEFRDQSWWKRPVYTRLAEKNIIFCGMSHPQLPEQVISNNETVYYRFHGAPKLYYSQYKKIFIENVVSQASKVKKLRKAYMYFNNTATTGALRNARYLQKITGE